MFLVDPLARSIFFPYPLEAFEPVKVLNANGASIDKFVDESSIVNVDDCAKIVDYGTPVATNEDRALGEVFGLLESRIPIRSRQ